jgi:hypothetical protein
MIREVCGIGKTGFQIYGTFKGSFLGYAGRTIEYETFFKFRRAGKGFVWNLDYSVLNLRVWY